MRPLWKDVLTALFMGLVVPGLLLNAGVLLLDSQAAPVAQETEETAETLPPKISLPVRIRAADGHGCLSCGGYFGGNACGFCGGGAKGPVCRCPNLRPEGL